MITVLTTVTRILSSHPTRKSVPKRRKKINAIYFYQMGSLRQGGKTLKHIFHNFFTVSLPFYIKTERVTFVLIYVQKKFIFTNPTQGHSRKWCFICWSKSHLSQSRGPYISRFALTKFWSHLTFCSLALKGLAFKIASEYPQVSSQQELVFRFSALS